MPFRFASLPQSATATIFHYLSESALLRLREVAYFQLFDFRFRSL